MPDPDEWHRPTPTATDSSTVNQPGQGIYTNNFDPRIQSIPSYLPGTTPGSSYTLKHGYMRTAFPKGESGQFYLLNFLYNPSEVRVSHSIDAANQVMPAYTRSDDDKGTPLVAAGGTVGFSLLFDRSYEMSDSSKFSTIEGTHGVMADIHVLYNLVGINSPQIVWNQGDGAASESSVDANNVIGIMQMRPIWVRFGQARHDFRDQLPNLSRMEYFGYVNSLEISYTHFSQRMMPVRCAVGVTMQLMSTAGWI